MRVAIRAGQEAADAAQGTERAAAIDRLIGLRRELFAIVDRGGQGSAAPMTALAEARRIAAAGGTVVMPVVTDFGAKLLIVSAAKAGKDVTVVDVPALNTRSLAELLVGPEDAPNTGWIGAYFVNYMDGPDAERRWPEWIAAIDRIGPELWRLFGGKLEAALKERGVKRGTRLVWLPSGWLGILPLGLVQDPASKRRLADDYQIVYAPSLEALTAGQQLIANPKRATLAAVVNPTGDLPGTEKEGALVAAHFASADRTVLAGGAATPDAVIAALKGKTHWHFASHGTFSWADARQSALLMHDAAPLSVGRLLETDGLGRPRLVVLSACETGLSDITSSPDEFIGLPGTFTALGAAGVLGTLWPVSDAATALLMAKFYDLHLEAGLDPPAALSGAQAWLRDATGDDLNGYAEVAAARGRLQAAQLASIAEELKPESLARSRRNAPLGADDDGGNADGHGADRLTPRCRHIPMRIPITGQGSFTPGNNCRQVNHTDQPHHTPANRLSTSKEDRRPRSAPCDDRKAWAELRPRSRKRQRNGHSAFSFDDAPKSASSSVVMRCTRMPAHRAPSALPASATCRSSAIMRSSLSSAVLNETSFTRLRMSRAERGSSRRSTGLIWMRIVSLDVHSRTNGVMVGLPAYPPSQ